MQGHFWHLFQTHFFMVPLVLLSRLAFSIIFWSVGILQHPIRFLGMGGFQSYHRKQNRGTMWKCMKKCIWNWCQKWPCILSGAIYQEHKRWFTYDKLCKLLWCRHCRQYSRPGCWCHWGWARPPGRCSSRTGRWCTLSCSQTSAWFLKPTSLLDSLRHRIAVPVINNA